MKKLLILSFCCFAAYSSSAQSSTISCNLPNDSMSLQLSPFLHNYSDSSQFSAYSENSYAMLESEPFQKSKKRYKRSTASSSRSGRKTSASNRKR